MQLTTSSSQLRKGVKSLKALNARELDEALKSSQLLASFTLTAEEQKAIRNVFSGANEGKETKLGNWS